MCHAVCACCGSSNRRISLCMMLCSSAPQYMNRPSIVYLSQACMTLILWAWQGHRSDTLELVRPVTCSKIRRSCSKKYALRRDAEQPAARSWPRRTGWARRSRRATAATSWCAACSWASCSPSRAPRAPARPPRPPQSPAPLTLPSRRARLFAMSDASEALDTVCCWKPLWILARHLLWQQAEVCLCLICTRAQACSWVKRWWEG